MNKLPVPVEVDSRICFGINYYDSEETAMKADTIIRERGDTYNGGYMHGMACGRDRNWDKKDKNGKTLFAVTTA